MTIFDLCPNLCPNLRLGKVIFPLQLSSFSCKRLALQMQILWQTAIILSFEILLMNRFLIPIPCLFESWLYRGDKKTISEHGGTNNWIRSPNIDDPAGHRTDTLGVGNHTSHICFVIVQVSDDLEGIVDTGGFGDCFQECISLLMAVDYLENMLDSTVGIDGGRAQPSAACTEWMWLIESIGLRAHVDGRYSGDGVAQHPPQTIFTGAAGLSSSPVARPRVFRSE
jgi:hypothetical protein